MKPQTESPLDSHTSAVVAVAKFNGNIAKRNKKTKGAAKMEK